jgi:hypothetical protein
MYNFSFRWKSMAAAVAALSVFAVASLAQAPSRNYKDGEYDIYNAVATDLANAQTAAQQRNDAGASQAYTKAISDLDAWKQKYAESEFKDDRAALYVTAYGGLRQYGKALEAASDAMAIPNGFGDPKTGAANEVRMLFLAVQALLQGVAAQQNFSPDQLAIADKVSRRLLDFNRKPEGTPDADWNTAKNQLQTAAKQALLTIAILPGDKALARNPQDCDTAVAAYTKALGEYPDKSFISYNLGRAYNCMAKKDQAHVADWGAKAIYEFVRAAAVDPTLGGTTDAKKISDYATSAYNTFHGSTEGLDQLKQQASGAALPPDGFKIETATAAAARRESEFKEKYPQLAMWMGIKGQLADTNGMQYFESTLKNAQVPKLKGTVVEGKCRAKEIQVAVPLPDQQGTPVPEITLKLDAPLTGKPELGEIQWEGVPTAFTKDPFMLTMETEKAKIEGLKVAACAGAPARKGTAKKSTAKKR